MIWYESTSRSYYDIRTFNNNSKTINMKILLAVLLFAPDDTSCQENRPIIAQISSSFNCRSSWHIVSVLSVYVLV